MTTTLAKNTKHKKTTKLTKSAQLNKETTKLIKST
jgi:hypothetical protein